MFKTLSVLLILIVYSGSLFAQSDNSPVPYETMNEFNKERLEAVIDNYGLSEEVKGSVILSPVEMRTLNVTDKQAQIIIPGLLIGGLNSENKKATQKGIFEIIKSLKDYRRDVSLIVKKEVDQEEIEALKAGIKDYLFLREDEQIAVEKKIFNLTAAMKNWRSDLKESLYHSFIKSGHWVWIPILLISFSLLGLLISFLISRSLRSIGSSIERGASSINEQSQQAMDQSFDEKESDDSDYQQEVETTISGIHEVEQTDTIQKVIDLYYKSKGELFSALWFHLPTAEKQISFFKSMSPFTNESNQTIFNEIIAECFRLNTEKYVNAKLDDEFTPESLNHLYTSLFCGLNAKANDVKSNLLEAIYPKYADRVDSLIDITIENHFSVLKFLFPEKVSNYLKKRPEKTQSLSSQIAFYYSKQDKNPTEMEIKAFTNVLMEMNPEELKSIHDEKENTIDKDTKQMLWSLPDSVLHNGDWSEQMSEVIQREIPNLTWVNDENIQSFKQFIISLDKQELQYIDSEWSLFEPAYEKLDDRTKIRIDEKRNDSVEPGSINFSKLRSKIKRHFKKPEKSGESSAEDINKAA